MVVRIAFSQSLRQCGGGAAAPASACGIVRNAQLRRRARRRARPQQLTDEMGLKATNSMIRVDATVAERFLSQPLHTSQMRHVNTKLLFVREHVKARLYEFGHVDGTVNPADALTKSLGGSTIEHRYGVVQSCNTHRLSRRKSTADRHSRDDKRGRKAMRARHTSMR